MVLAGLESVWKSIGWLRREKPESYDAEMLVKFFEPGNRSLTPADFSFAFRASDGEDGRNLFEMANVEQSSENTLNLLANFMRTELASEMPSALDSDIEPEAWEFDAHSPTSIQLNESLLLTMLYSKNDERSRNISSDASSLSRHLMRAPALEDIFISECLGNLEIDFEDSKRLTEFAQVYLGGTHPFHMKLSAYLHDFPRHITHSSEHDSLVPKLMTDIGVLPSIIQSIHEPVPADHVVQDPAHYDNGAQKLIRLADVFGKVIPRSALNHKLRTTVDEIFILSQERQQGYFEAEVDTPGTFWHGKTEKNLRIYLANERRVLNQATSWFENVSGVPFSNLMQSINDNPNNFELADKHHIPNASG